MLRQYIKIGLWGLLILAVQIGTAPLIQVFDARPDLLLVFTVVITFRFGRNTGLIVGFVAGLAQDIVGIGYFGVNALALSTIAFWISMFFDRNDIVTQLTFWAVLNFLAYIVKSSIAAVFVLYGTETTFWGYFVFVILPEALYTAVCATIAGTLLLKGLRKVMHSLPQIPVRRDRNRVRIRQ